MSLHRVTGRRRLGLLLSIITAFLWGILPIVLKVVLGSMDGYTITWYRMIVSSVLLGIFVLHKHGKPSFAKIGYRVALLFAVCVIGLNSNYVFYVLGLNFLSPSTAVVVIQLAPISLLVGGLIVFGERFSARQYIGFIVFVAGLALFFNDRLGDLVHSFGAYTKGVLLIFIAAVVWGCYAMAQKQLLNVFPSETIMAVIYAGGAMLLFPLSSPATITHLNWVKLLLLAFCALNTIAAYGCFSEALNHLEASRVSAILALIPLFTIAGMKLIGAISATFIAPEMLNGASILGALMVVAGSMLTSLSKQEGLR